MATLEKAKGSGYGGLDDFQGLSNLNNLTES
jgi:hypothetical protein